MEIYTESKHELMFAAQRGLLNLWATPGKLTTRDMFVPTCATCHMSGINGRSVQHRQQLLGDQRTVRINGAIEKRVGKNV